MANTVKRAIIVGGGIGGLCTAIALRQIGVDVTVYEKVNELANVGAGLTLWTNAIKALRQLGLAEVVLKHGAKLQVGEFRTWRGKTLASVQTGEVEQLYGDPTIAIHRADLHRILLAALPEAAVRWGAACAGFEQDHAGITIHFTNVAISSPGWWPWVPFVAVHLLLLTSLSLPIALASISLAVASSLPFAYLFDRGHRTIWAPALLHFVVHAIKLVNIPDAFYTPVVLAWMATCAMVPYLVFAFPQRFFTPDQRADEV